RVRPTPRPKIPVLYEEERPIQRDRLNQRRIDPVNPVNGLKQLRERAASSRTGRGLEQIKFACRAPGERRTARIVGKSSPIPAFDIRGRGSRSKHRPTVRKRGRLGRGPTICYGESDD